MLVLLALVPSIAAVDGVKERLKLPARRTFREAAEAAARANRSMAAAECADKLVRVYNTHALRSRPACKQNRE